MPEKLLIFRKRYFFLNKLLDFKNIDVLLQSKWMDKSWSAHLLV